MKARSMIRWKCDACGRVAYVHWVFLRKLEYPDCGKRSIEDEPEYEAAIERIGQLMGAEPDTPQGDELELLATLVEAYEEERFPVGLPDPVEAARFRTEQAGSKADD